MRRADGSGPEIRLTDFGNEAGPAVWMHDSRTLVFESQEPGSSPVVTKMWMVEINPDSGKAVSKKEFPVPREIRSVSGIDFSPRGTEIAFLGEDDEGKAIWVQDAEEGTLTRVASYISSTRGGVDWSPDGRTVVYAALGAHHMEIFAVSREGESWSKPRRLAGDEGDLIHPQISADGRWVACSRVKWTKTLRLSAIGTR